MISDFSLLFDPIGRCVFGVTKNALYDEGGRRYPLPNGRADIAFPFVIVPSPILPSCKIHNLVEETSYELKYKFKSFIEPAAIGPYFFIPFIGTTGTDALLLDMRTGIAKVFRPLTYNYSISVIYSRNVQPIYDPINRKLYFPVCINNNFCSSEDFGLLIIDLTNDSWTILSLVEENTLDFLIPVCGSLLFLYSGGCVVYTPGLTPRGAIASILEVGFSLDPPTCITFITTVEELVERKIGMIPAYNPGFFFSITNKHMLEFAIVKDRLFLGIRKGTFQAYSFMDFFSLSSNSLFCISLRPVQFKQLPVGLSVEVLDVFKENNYVVATRKD